MTDVLQDVLWVEKYRPTRLKDLALDPDTRAVLEAYLKAGEIPHLFFVGPPGTGKTTVARIIYKTINCRYIVLNASAERGIDTVREKISSFAQADPGMTDAQWNIVFLDEADALTVDAQTALRNMIEAYADQSRFILTANRQHKVIGPLQSRCQMLLMSAPPLKERVRILQGVLKAEKIEAKVPVIFSYAERYSDLRQMLNAAQRCYLAKHMMVPATESGPIVGESVLERIEKKDWTGLRRLTSSDGFDAQQALTSLFWAIPDTHAKCGFLRLIVGKAVHETSFTPDPAILFLGTCAEAMEGL